MPLLRFPQNEDELNIALDEMKLAGADESEMIDLVKKFDSGIRDNKQPVMSTSELQDTTQTPNFLERIGAGIKATPNIAKAGIEKISEGGKDIVGSFKDEGILGESKVKEQGIDRSFQNRATQFLRGISRIGSGALVTATGVTPVGAGFSGVMGAIEPEIQEGISNLLSTEKGKKSLEMWQSIPEQYREGFINIVDSLPFAKVKNAEMLSKGVESSAKIAGKTVSGAVKGVGNLGSQVFGKTTGTSGETIKEAFRQGLGGKEEFTKALRGQISPEDTLEDVKSSLQKIKDTRKELYGADYEKIAGNKTPIDISDIKNDFIQKLKDNSIDIIEKVNKKGVAKTVLDFTNSKLRKASQGIRELKDTFDDIMNWENTTPEGLDILKQRIREGYKGSIDTGLSDSIHTEFANKIKSKISNIVPEYEKMNKTYESITNEINDITKTLSLGNKTQAQTAITKLSSALRDNFPFRKDMVELIEKYSGKNIKGQIVGQQLNPALAKGLAGVITGGGIAFGQLANPAFWGGLLATSPRLIGEIANATGKSVKAIKDSAKNISRILKIKKITGKLSKGNTRIKKSNPKSGIMTEPAMLEKEKN